MDNIRDLLAENKITLAITDTSSEGFYVPKLKTMFVNQDLSEEKQKQVILHETKHALDHSEYAVLYQSVVQHTKMESEANNFMIDYLIEESGGQFDYTTVVEEFKLGLVRVEM